MVFSATQSPLGKWPATSRGPATVVGDVGRFPALPAWGPTLGCTLGRGVEQGGQLQKKTLKRSGETAPGKELSWPRETKDRPWEVSLP